jgi:hypothetical protein
MCNNRELHSLSSPLKVILGGGHAIGYGTVTLQMKVAKQTWKPCKLFDVLYVPKLSFNLLSVLKQGR